MDQPVDGGYHHGPAGGDLVPLARWLIRRYAKRTMLIPGADELEQHQGLSLIIADVCKIVQDNEIEAIFDDGCNNEWASLPRGVYGQGGAGMNTVNQKFSQYLDDEMNGTSDLTVPIGGLDDLIN